MICQFVNNIVLHNYTVAGRGSNNIVLHNYIVAGRGSNNIVLHNYTVAGRGSNNIAQLHSRRKSSGGPGFEPGRARLGPTNHMPGHLVKKVITELDLSS